MSPAATTTGKASTTVKVSVTVTDVVGVQRVLTMMTGRGYVLTRFEADEAGDGRWRVSLDLTADPDLVEVLVARLRRFPDVLLVGLRSGALAAVG